MAAVPLDTAEFAPRATYLDTPTHGLLPARTVAALRDATDRLATGDLHVPDCLDDVAAARAAFARLSGVPAERVAVGSSTAGFVALVAAAQQPGAEILLAEGDFSSVTTPFDQRGDLRTRQVPLDALAGEISPRTALVAVSAAQSADGRVADLTAIRAAARRHGARTLVDTTQSTGWLPLSAGDFDYTVCAAYKWLLSPRGVSFLTVPADHGQLRPVHASWVAGADPWAEVYRPVERLAQDARRFDEGLAFLPCLGAATSLPLIEEVGVAAVGAHGRALADHCRAGLARQGRPAPHADGPIVAVRGLGDAATDLARAGVRASVRAGQLRVGFHLYNSTADVDRLLDVLDGLPVTSRSGPAPTP